MCELDLGPILTQQENDRVKFILVNNVLPPKTPTGGWQTGLGAPKQYIVTLVFLSIFAFFSTYIYIRYDLT